MALYDFVLCRSSGEPVGQFLTARARGLSLLLNGVHSASVTVPLGDPVARDVAPGLSRLKVWRNPAPEQIAKDPSTGRVLVFYGSLPAVGVDEQAAAETMALTFEDPRWVLARRFTLGTEVYTATDRGQILWGLIATQNARPGGDTWIRQGSTVTGVAADRAFDRRQVSGVFAEMTRLIDGPDLDVTPIDGYETGLGRVMGNLQVVARQGVTRPAAVFNYGTQIGSNIRDVKRTYRDVTTLATVTGTGPAGQPLTDTYGSPSSSEHGLLEEYVADPDGTNLSYVQFRARGIVLAQQTPRPIVQLTGPTPGAPRPFEDYALGDTVTVNARKGSMVIMDARLRVHAINLTLDQTGTETVSLTTAEV